MASACGIEASGGPVIDMKYGRLDGVPVDLVERNFSEVSPPYSKTEEINKEDPIAYLKSVFGRLGIEEHEEIVSLYGAHTLGRVFIERSGHVKEGYRRGTKYTSKGCPYLQNSETAGGRSWTKTWLTFDNSYYSEVLNPSKDKNTVCFPTDSALSTHPDFKPYFHKFAENQNEFFNSYKVSHKKMSELGSKFSPPNGIVL